MIRRSLLASLALALTWSMVHADEVHTRRLEKPLKGKIKSENAQGITLVVMKETMAIPAEDITDVLYEEDEVAFTISFRTALKEEKDLDSKDPKKVEKRKENLAEVIKKYEDSATKAKMLPGQRNAQFKAAWLRLRQAQEEGGDLAAAIKRLDEFTRKHSDGWQTPRSLLMVARLSIDQQDYDAAEDSYKRLAGLDVSEEMKQDAELQAATVYLRISKEKGKEAEVQKKYLEALKKVQGLAGGVDKSSKFAVRLRIAEAECMGRAGQASAAIPVLQQILKESTDRSLKAAAYNALGVTHYDAGQPKEARWDFLWVDVEYNQDKAEHAKALYYLAKIFEDLGEPERAQECRQSLLTSRDFLGLEYQRLAQRLVPTKSQ